MSVLAEKTVRQWALESAAATRVFEQLGIDYCCGGGKSLEAACQAANLTPERVLAAVEAAEKSAQAGRVERDWQTAPLAELAAHIRNTHHQYTREELARLGPLFNKVCSAHGEKHPE